MEPESRTGRDEAALAIGLIVGAVFLLSFADALVRQLGAASSISLWQLFVARGLIAVPILVALSLRYEGIATLWPRSPAWTLLRSALLVSMWIAYYAALPLMSLSAAATALYTTPLFIAVFSARLLGKPAGRRQWVGIAVGFAGVLIALRPGKDVLSFVTLLPVAAAVSYALAAVVTRSRCAAERPLTLSLALNVCLLGVGALATAALSLRPPDPSAASAYPFLLGGWTPMRARDWGVMALLAVLLVTVSTATAKAYQVGPTTIVGTFDYAYLVFAALWSFALFAEAPDGATVTGMILITTAGFLVVGRPAGAARRRRGPRSPSSLRPS